VSAKYHKVKIEVNAGGVVVSGQKTYEEELDTSVEVEVAGTTTDKEVLLSIDISQLTSLIMVSDQDLTVETNSASVPDDTITLAANVPYVWNADLYGQASTKLTADVTALYLTNAGATAATFKCEILYDPTP